MTERVPTVEELKHEATEIGSAKSYANIWNVDAALTHLAERLHAALVRVEELDNCSTNTAAIAGKFQSEVGRLRAEVLVREDWIDPRLLAICEHGHYIQLSKDTYAELDRLRAGLREIVHQGVTYSNYNGDDVKHPVEDRLRLLLAERG